MLIYYFFVISRSNTFVVNFANFVNFKQMELAKLELYSAVESVHQFVGTVP